MSLKKYKWIVGSATHRKGDIVEMEEQDAEIRLILKHLVLYVEDKKVEKRIGEIKKSYNEILSYIKGLVYWEKKEMGVDAICFHKKDKKKVMKILPDLLEKGYVIDGDIIKDIKADNIITTKLYFV